MSNRTKKFLMVLFVSLVFGLGFFPVSAFAGTCECAVGLFETPQGANQDDFTRCYPVDPLESKNNSKAVSFISLPSESNFTKEQCLAGKVPSIRRAHHSLCSPNSPSLTDEQIADGWGMFSELKCVWNECKIRSRESVFPGEEVEEDLYEYYPNGSMKSWSRNVKNKYRTLIAQNESSCKKQCIEVATPFFSDKDTNELKIDKFDCLYNGQKLLLNDAFEAPNTGTNPWTCVVEFDNSNYNLLLLDYELKLKGLAAANLADPNYQSPDEAPLPQNPNQPELPSPPENNPQTLSKTRCINLKTDTATSSPILSEDMARKTCYDICQKGNIGQFRPANADENWTPLSNPKGCYFLRTTSCQDNFKFKSTGNEKVVYGEWVLPDIGKLNQSKINNPAKVVSTLIGVVMGISGSIAFALFVYAGFLWMTAMGNSDKHAQAIKIITWTALGIIVMLSSYVLADFVISIFVK